MKADDARIDATLLGKIMLARCLELPLKIYDRLVCQTEASADFAALRPELQLVPLGPSVTPTGPAAQVDALLGSIQATGSKLIFQYQRGSYARSYRIDEERVAWLRSQPGFTPAQASVLRRLHLINTRNRFTDAVIQAAIHLQGEYLRSGDALALAPLTQASMAAHLRTHAGLAMVADPGRISRLVRGIYISLPNRTVLPLAALFTKPRQVQRQYVAHIIKSEQAQMLDGELQEPMRDDEIAAALARQYGVAVSRRTVANMRHDLAIPDSRHRRQRMHYLSATEGFSALMPLTVQTLRTCVPPHSGVYEIRTLLGARHLQERSEREMLPMEHSVLYIGSAGNLRRRLADHLRGTSDNAQLHGRIAGGGAKVRFQLVGDEWRQTERRVYQAFCTTFGLPPMCNRMSP